MRKCSQSIKDLSNNNRGAVYSAPHNIEEENKMKNIELTEQEFALFMHLYNRGKDDLFQEMHFDDKFDDQDIFWHKSLCDTIEGKTK